MPSRTRVDARRHRCKIPVSGCGASGGRQGGVVSLAPVG